MNHALVLLMTTSEEGSVEGSEAVGEKRGKNHEREDRAHPVEKGGVLAPQEYVNLVASVLPVKPLLFLLRQAGPPRQKLKVSQPAAFGAKELQKLERLLQAGDSRDLRRGAVVHPHDASRSDTDRPAREKGQEGSHGATVDRNERRGHVLHRVCAILLHKASSSCTSSNTDEGAGISSPLSNTLPPAAFQVMPVWVEARGMRKIPRVAELVPQGHGPHQRLLSVDRDHRHMPRPLERVARDLHDAAAVGPEVGQASGRGGEELDRSRGRRGATALCGTGGADGGFEGEERREEERRGDEHGLWVVLGVGWH